MKRPEPRLEQIQRWMQSVIMHRGGVSEAVDAPETRQYLDVTLDELESVIRPSAALSGAERLEIYVNAYYARLMECLDEEFAVTRYALGDELFAAVAFGYLQFYPSQSYTLGELGARFPRFLAELRLHAQATPQDAPESWAEFVVELATLERVLYEVYDGPGTERGGTLNPDELARIPPDALQELRLVAAPCLRLRRFEHPVQAYWAARKDGGQPDACRPRPTRLAIHRRDFRVEQRELTAAQFGLLSEITAGANLSRALAVAIAASPADEVPGEAQIGRWFAEWTRDGYFAALSQRSA